MIEAVKEQTSVLDIRNLKLELKPSHAAGVNVLDGVSLRVGKGEIIGVVGESGCGKSVLSLSVLGLLPRSMRISSGEIWYREQHPLHLLKNGDIRRIRGKEVSMVFQDPMSSLNPGLTVGYQVTETLRLHMSCSRKEARDQAVLLFRKVGLPRPEALLDEYPHQLSGGMRQRVMIAIAISCNPSLLIGDEPTTALDVTIQAQILDVMRKIREEDGTSIMLISHDLGVIADMCDRIAVMYAGRIVEEGTPADLFERSRHPYTIGLLNAIPTPAKKGGKLYSIAGNVPGLHEREKGCRFASRCEHVMEHCLHEEPPLLPIGDRHSAACFLIAEERVRRNAVV